MELKKLVAILAIITALATPTLASDILAFRGVLEFGNGDCIVTSNSIVFTLEAKRNCINSGIGVMLPNGTLIIDDFIAIETVEGYLVVANVSVTYGAHKVKFYVSNIDSIARRNINVVESLSSPKALIDTINIYTYNAFIPALTLLFMATVAVRVRNPAYVFGAYILLSLANFALFGFKVNAQTFVIIVLGFALAMYNVLWRRGVW